MKINILHIITNHFKTLYDARNKSSSYFDIVVFYILPIALSLWAYCNSFELKENSFNVLITFFGIFIALLLNIQVAIFSVFQRKWDQPQDRKLKIIQDDEISDRRVVLTELNTNLAYLILICCIVLFVCILSIISSKFNLYSSAFMVFAFMHFLATLLMIVKRSHALFHKEYRDSP